MDRTEQELQVPPLRNDSTGYTGPHTLVLDIETKLLADEAPGRPFSWTNKQAMGISVAVTWDSISGTFEHYIEPEMHHLVDALLRADQVVGYNVLTFDYVVLSAYIDDANPFMSNILRPLGFVRAPNGTWCNADGISVLDVLHTKTIDLIQHIRGVTGRLISLERVATGTLGTQKLATGVQAVMWFKEGNMEALKQYCQEDVRITRDIWLQGLAHGYVRYQVSQRTGRQQFRLAPATWYTREQEQ